MSLGVVRDLRVARAPVTAEDLAALQTDVLAGFVLARAAAGLSDGTIASDVLHLEQVRAWFGRPLWDMEPADADAYFGKVLRDTAKGTGSGVRPRPQDRHPLRRERPPAPHHRGRGARPRQFPRTQGPERPIEHEGTTVHREDPSVRPNSGISGGSQ